VNFTSCISALLTPRSPHIHPLPLQPPCQNKTNEASKQTATKLSIENITLLKLQYVTVWTTVYPSVQIFIVMSHWSGLRSLASVTLSISDPHWGASWLSCCLMSWRSKALEQQDWPIHKSQSLVGDIDFGVIQFRALDLGLGSSWTGQPTSSFFICTTNEDFSGLLWLGHSMEPLAGGRAISPALMPSWWFTCTHASRASSYVLLNQGVEPILPSAIDCGSYGNSYTFMTSGLVLQTVAGGKGWVKEWHQPHPHASSCHMSGLTHLGSALLCCPGEVQGPLSRVLQLVRVRASSHELMTPIEGFPRCWRWWGTWSPLSLYHHVGDKWWYQLSHIDPRDVHLYPSHQGQLYCAAWARNRACFPECCHWWKMGPTLQSTFNEGLTSYA